MLQRLLLPGNTNARKIGRGVLWGWLPCGLSTTLPAAAWLQADARNGALTIAACGVGTLPMMLPLTWSGARPQLWMPPCRWRLAVPRPTPPASLRTMDGRRLDPRTGWKHSQRGTRDEGSD